MESVRIGLVGLVTAALGALIPFVLNRYAASLKGADLTVAAKLIFAILVTYGRWVGGVLLLLGIGMAVVMMISLITKLYVRTQRFRGDL